MTVVVNAMDNERKSTLRKMGSPKRMKLSNVNLKLMMLLPDVVNA